MTEWRAFRGDHPDTSWSGIVVGFDGTDRARCAVRWAAAEAAVRGCPLHLVRVVVHKMPAVVAGWLPVLVGPDEWERDLLVDELIAEVDACRATYPGLVVHAAVHDGAPREHLAGHADLVGADVLAVGCSGNGAVPRALLGSTGAGLVRSADRLVVVVRDETPVQQAGTATGFAPVVALLDDEATCARVLTVAFDMADRLGARVTVLHHETRALPHDRLDRVRRWRPRVPVGFESTAADMYQAVLDMSAEARLIVMGARRHTVVQRLLAGPPGRKVPHDARCTVAVVP